MKYVSIAIILFLSVSLKAQHDHHKHHDHQSLQAKEPTAHSLFHLNSEWTTHDNKKINFKDLDKKKSVMAMVFTSCPSACPMIVSEMKEMQDEAKNKDINYYLFSFDSKRDKPKKLKAFKEKMKLDKNWTLFHAKESNVRELANVLGVQYKKTADNNFIHSNVIFVLNKNGEVICQKEGLKPNVKVCLKGLNN
ncbi:MAG: SCO family protein [Bdellovibrionales bacterium]|nr:SCO family protein [Bdellovibrionales bacterium]